MYHTYKCVTFTALQNISIQVEIILKKDTASTIFKQNISQKNRFSKCCDPLCSIGFWSGLCILRLSFYFWWSILSKVSGVCFGSLFCCKIQFCCLNNFFADFKKLTFTMPLYTIMMVSVNTSSSAPPQHHKNSPNHLHAL